MAEASIKYGFVVKHAYFNNKRTLQIKVNITNNKIISQYFCFDIV